MEKVIDRTLRIVECPRCGTEDSVVGSVIAYCQACGKEYHPVAVGVISPKGTCLACPHAVLEWYPDDAGLRQAFCGVTGLRVFRVSDRTLRKECPFARMVT